MMALLNGKTLAGIVNDEYGVFIKMEENNQNVHKT